jgi:hypothetical protein
VSDMDGDIAMGGTGTGQDENDLGMTADGKRKRLRKKKIEGYDREDPFIDDSEMAWQEHAAASKDGFFVYSGPLVPEGEKVSIEKYVSSLLSMAIIFTNVNLQSQRTCQTRTTQSSSSCGHLEPYLQHHHCCPWPSTRCWC